MDIRKAFCDNLLKLREKKRLTQSQVAEYVGISLRKYQKYEYGENFPKPEMLEALANYFGVEPSYFLKINHEKKTVGNNVIATPKTSKILQSLVDHSELVDLLVKIPKGNKTIEVVTKILESELEDLEEESHSDSKKKA